jgi:hypothetical protein
MPEGVFSPTNISLNKTKKWPISINTELGKGLIGYNLNSYLSIKNVNMPHSHDFFFCLLCSTLKL